VNSVIGFTVIMTIWISIGVFLGAWLTLAEQHRNDPLRATRTGGALTAIVATLMVPAMPFVPFGIYTRESPGTGGGTETTTQADSMWAIGIEPFQLLVLGLVWGAALLVGVTVLGASSGRTRYGSILRWVAVGLLVVLTVLSSFTIGWLFLPVTLLALLTAIHGSRSLPESPDSDIDNDDDDEQVPETG
jgi:hypothetical protein